MGRGSVGMKNSNFLLPITFLNNSFETANVTSSAAVLTGAVLEKSLRTLCDQQNPPILTFKTTTKGKSEPLTLNPLIDELKKAAVFNELKAKQLRFWADSRNAAAHGEFDKFSRSDVEQMIEGVKNFLATYML